MTCRPLMFLICCTWLAKCWQITTKLNPKTMKVFLKYISLWLWNTSVSELLHVKNNISHSHSSQLCSKKFFYMFSGVGQLLVLPGVGWVLAWDPRVLSPPVQCPPTICGQPLPCPPCSLGISYTKLLRAMSSHVVNVCTDGDFTSVSDNLSQC